MVNTIVAGNTATDSGPDCFSSITSQGHNFIGSQSGCSFTKATGDITGTVNFPLDPLLGPLQDNGGPTFTHALLAGSSAIDGGDDTAAPATDQRGIARPLGAADDIGAYETTLVGTPRPAPQSGSIQITKLDDSFDGFCDTDCSLREAAALAGSGDSIVIPAGTYTLTLATQITIDNNLTLTGAGASTTIIQAASNADDATWPVFAVSSGNSVAISGVTIRYGNAGGSGGGVLNSGTLALANSTISDNTSLERGGGIYNNGGTLTLTDTTISNNTTRRQFGGEFGGGIANVGGTLTLTNATISGNRTWNFGAGVYNTGTATLTNTTVSDNSVWQGAGIYNTGTLSLTNTTVSGNTGTFGAGIRNNGGTVTLTNSTVSGNSVNDDGGGIYNNGTVELVNTIVAGNTATDSGPDCFPAITSQGHNFIGSLFGCSFTKATGDITGTIDFALDAKLGLLQDNGGPTFTHALLAGSPAIDGGDDSAAPATDQRGVVRPQGLQSDIGAFELGFADLAVFKSVDDSSPRVDEIVTFTVTLTNNGPGAATGW